MAKAKFLIGNCYDILGNKSQFTQANTVVWRIFFEGINSFLIAIVIPV